MALKPRAHLTRSPKEGYQWLHKKDLHHQKIKTETKNTIREKKYNQEPERLVKYMKNYRLACFSHSVIQCNNLCQCPVFMQVHGISFFDHFVLQVLIMCSFSFNRLSKISSVLKVTSKCVKNLLRYWWQECIPVGCVLSATVSISGDVCLPGVCVPAGGVCLPAGGVCLPGGVYLGGVCPGGGLVSACTPLPCGQIGTCENITFPQLLLWAVIMRSFSWSIGLVFVVSIVY